MEIFKVNGKLNGKKLALSVLVPVAGGALVGWLANKDSKQDYAKLEKPAFSPPPSVFPVVWTGLYTKMGLARYRIAEKAEQMNAKSESLLVYNTQLGLNFLWSFLFFKWNLRGTALIEMTILLGAILMTMWKFYEEDRLAGLMMTPYLGWVGFALALNYSIWSMNKQK
ncbi:TspO/MBR family protein [Aciduricibacillus chroicocephali]|uniref:TspO/MBR family protein n=1 Tax=Aciduricibacillus chroicocephali TaxID=3054939 RepID=A0ABY9KVR4_9BACI|nr:TspO/MBR family protein [Bacillaceae bacterium 44XB]